MDYQKLAIPALAFAGGAVLGRIFGLTTLVRGAMTAAAVTGLGSAPLALASPDKQTARKPARRASHKRAPQKRSRRVASR